MSELDDTGRWFQGLAQDLRQARGLPGVLDVAYRAFEVMLTVAAQHQDPDGGLFAAFVMAAASAADGRDAVALAPSLPPAGLPGGDLAMAQGWAVGAGEAADRLAVLGEVVSGLLTRAGQAAADPRDRVACAQAAGHAREVHSLLVGG